MSATNKLTIVLILGIACVLPGCSTGAAPVDSVQVSDKDLKASEIARANQILDTLQNVPESGRQIAANGNPRSAETLKAAAALDPKVQERISQLGITLK